MQITVFFPRLPASEWIFLYTMCQLQNQPLLNVGDAFHKEHLVIEANQEAFRIEDKNSSSI